MLSPVNSLLGFFWFVYGSELEEIKGLLCTSPSGPIVGKNRVTGQMQYHSIEIGQVGLPWIT